MNKEEYTGQDLDIREHEIENILGRAPGGLLRIGITVIFGVFVILLAGSAFFCLSGCAVGKGGGVGGA